ncbi:hypothetical protein B1U23_05545 (plasmid) [Borreliella burgdorferi]|uniref:Uncharacterized protein BBD24 n=1 Tax=Borreliella burgdorferi (strain ATCC 35210 / DSM 4680 / CIP 102532 / B31) TaxID=224326 RepID=Y2824_BORBU|nr:RecName: Full=Uncharacterized protein BBD24 [Borreliella burgdorferi B31]AAB38563.1 CdsO [Borreliella burgdorferi]AAC66355.1 conserved hypothetical protein [Borreliella burgdorferi B31]ARS30834.1 hypothetical protein B1U23_05545 [Borreliella burgdorferi]ARS32096.1 hypothetical protein B1U22_05690 [Borreliella burgdorferi]ARS32558.1 hypothetical protein B1U21_01445 [Borreliella burgdorferi]
MTAIIVYSCLTMCVIYFHLQLKTFFTKLIRFCKKCFDIFLLLIEMLKLIFYLLIINNKFYIFIIISIALITINTMI